MLIRNMCSCSLQELPGLKIIDAIDATIVGMFADSKEARADIREVPFLPFSPGDKKAALNNIDADGKCKKSLGSP